MCGHRHWPRKKVHLTFRQGFLLHHYPCLEKYTKTPSPGVEETGEMGQRSKCCEVLLRKTKEAKRDCATNSLCDVGKVTYPLWA